MNKKSVMVFEWKEKREKAVRVIKTVQARKMLISLYKVYFIDKGLPEDYSHLGIACRATTL